MFQSIVLIDDDILVREHWERRCRKAACSITTYPSRWEFQRVSAGVRRTSQIFVDRHLGDGDHGVEFARQLHEGGFSKVYLCTEDHDPRLASMPWLSGVVGKLPPAWLFESQWTAPVTAEERRYYVDAMNGKALALYQGRMGDFMGVLYGGDGVGFAGLVADGFSLPQEVMNAWERAILKGLTDEEIKLQTDEAWRTAGGR